MGIKNQEQLTATTNSSGDVTINVLDGTTLKPDDVTGVLATVNDAYANFIRAVQVSGGTGAYWRFRIYKIAADNTVHAATNQQVTFTFAVLA